jgi:hypothetical protein
MRRVGAVFELELPCELGRERPDGSGLVTVERGEVSFRLRSTAAELVAPGIAVERGAFCIEREHVGAIDLHYLFVLFVPIVGSGGVHPELSGGSDVVDDPKPFDVALTVDRALDSGRYEEESRVKQVDSERGEDGPGEPIVSLRSLFRIEDEIADCNLAIV